MREGQDEPSLESMFDGSSASITVERAISLIVEAADFPATISVFRAVGPGGNGQLVHKLSDGKRLGEMRAEASFLSFCSAEGVTPRDPFAPWLADYFENPAAHRHYEITAAEFKLFASRYGLQPRSAKKDRSSDDTPDVRAKLGEQSAVFWIQVLTERFEELRDQLEQGGAYKVASTWLASNYPERISLGRLEFKYLDDFGNWHLIQQKTLQTKISELKRLKPSALPRGKD